MLISSGDDSSKRTRPAFGVDVAPSLCRRFSLYGGWDKRLQALQDVAYNLVVGELADVEIAIG